MGITIKKEIETFSDLREATWCCEFVLDAIEKANKEDEFMNYIEAMFECGETPTMTELNDFIRFDTDTIFEEMGLDEDGNEPEENEEEEDED